MSFSGIAVCFVMMLLEGKCVVCLYLIRSVMSGFIAVVRILFQFNLEVHFQYILILFPSQLAVLCFVLINDIITITSISVPGCTIKESGYLYKLLHDKIVDL